MFFDMSAINHGFELQSRLAAPVIPEVYTGVNPYLTGDKKQVFESTITGLLQPAMGTVNGLTQLAIHHRVSPDNIYVDVRGDIPVPKIRTMHEPEAGSERDVNQYSKRIINIAAHIARVVGLDETPQFDLKDAENEFIVGPRKLQKGCIGKVALLASQDGVPEEDIELWLSWQKHGPSGLIAPSQALRKFKRYRLDGKLGASMTIREDIDYIKHTGSIRKDALALARSVNILANAVVFATPGILVDAVKQRQD